MSHPADSQSGRVHYAGLRPGFPSPDGQVAQATLDLFDGAEEPKLFAELRAQGKSVLEEAFRPVFELTEHNEQLMALVRLLPRYVEHAHYLRTLLQAAADGYPDASARLSTAVEEEKAEIVAADDDLDFLVKQAALNIARARAVEDRLPPRALSLSDHNDAVMAAWAVIWALDAVYLMNDERVSDTFPAFVRFVLEDASRTCYRVMRLIEIEGAEPEPVLRAEDISLPDGEAEELLEDADDAFLEVLEAQADG